MDFDIIETKKLGGNWQQEFAVVRKKFVYLRVVGDGAVYRVMTATVGDDMRGWRLCQDKQRLWEAASQLAKTHNLSGNFSNDTMARQYVQLFNIIQEHGETDEKFTEFFWDQMREFFSIYDTLEVENS
jgi:hypothetical protein